MRPQLNYEPNISRVRRKCAWQVIGNNARNMLELNSVNNPLIVPTRSVAHCIHSARMSSTQPERYSRSDPAITQANDERIAVNVGSHEYRIPTNYICNVPSLILARLTSPSHAHSYAFTCLVNAQCTLRVAHKSSDFNKRMKWFF